jgi:hypothetical protein
MDGRAQLRRLMSDVDVAATRAERSLVKARARTFFLSKAAAETNTRETIALRSSLILACLLMAARLIAGQN